MKPFFIEKVDVLCVGHAAYDLIFSVARHPGADEKIVAEDFIQCGGGPAANAAVCVSRLGYNAAFAGFLGTDVYGEKHLQELLQEGVDTALVVRGPAPTPLSTVIVKPDGKRALINYKGACTALEAKAIDFSNVLPKVILFDGHEPHLSLALAGRARHEGILTVLDAGSVHEGTLALMNCVDYLACSEKFARQFAGDIPVALARFAELAPNAIITLGEKGLIWQRGQEHGRLPAFAVNAIDSTGAGDAFHGALAAGIAAGLPWLALLRYASAAGALCCTKMGARQGLPSKSEHAALLNRVPDL
ncbi:MAG: PfkB family carbohydrate kinase [Methylococcales bacterium]